VSLIAVVNGDVYERYAQQLFDSAREHLRPPRSCPVLCLALAGRSGWPDATMYRYHSVLEHQDEIPQGYVFMSDADMLFEGTVGPEILPDGPVSRRVLTATLHPGYVGRPRSELPYERRSESACAVAQGEGEAYYCGGFVGGTRAGFLELARRIAALIDEDARSGITPRWHDESALNRVLATRAPERILSPAYCHPDHDDAYRSSWPEDYPRLLVALDKSSSERRARGRLPRFGILTPALHRATRYGVFTLRAQTSRIRSPIFWRALYAVLRAPVTVATASRLARRTARPRRSDPADLVERFSHLFLTGWPHHLGTPWINLNVSRFTWDVKRHLQSAAPVRPRQRRSLRISDTLNVGLLANLASTLTFSPPFFECAPDTVALAAFDVGGADRSAGYLAEHIQRYEAFSATDTAQIAAAIEAADLDLLLFDIYKADIYGILDRVAVPCVVDVCTTVQLRFHPNVSFHLYCLQQADYLIRGNRLFCGTSESGFDDRTVYPGALLFDRRGLDPLHVRPWRRREPLMVYHGKLYKLSDMYLETVFRLLVEDRDLRLVIVGRDDGGHLERITATAARLGVAHQLAYEGSFDVARSAAGEVEDPSWLRLAETLRVARLAPDPWPLGGASSRIEAYAAGTPVVHMGVRSDPSSWRRPQEAVTADHPALEIPEATVYTSSNYFSVAKRALYDEAFADALAAKQAERALELCDGGLFWAQILRRYSEWISAAGDRAR
jgi:glycosyltransferase involved in cell wall biosynthesis